LSRWLDRMDPGREPTGPEHPGPGRGPPAPARAGAARRGRLGPWTFGRSRPESPSTRSLPGPPRVP